MVTNVLCKSFQHLRIAAKGKVLSRYCSTNTAKVVNNGTLPFVYEPPKNGEKSCYEPNFRLASLYSSLDLGLPNRPGAMGEIGEFPFNANLRIDEPSKIEQRQEDTVMEKSLDLPPLENTIEKQAERMIVIRRRKMRKHKLKKLRKRMKFVWGKIRQKREMKKEKAFHAKLLAKIRAAEAYDPKKHIIQRLAVLDTVRIPNKYRGVELPEAQIKEFLKKDEEKRQAKRNKPRITL